MKTKLTNRELVSHFNALSRVEKPEQVTDKNGHNVSAPYDLDEKVRYSIARNLKRLKQPVQDYSDAREILMRTHGGKTGPRDSIVFDDPDKEIAFAKAFKDLLTEEVEVDLHPCDLTGWKLGENKHMPMTIVSDLLDTVIVDDVSVQVGTKKE